MLSYRCLIVGGGMTADAACKGIRERDAEEAPVEHDGHANRHGRRAGAYLDGAGRPRGFLLWGIFGRVDAARELIRVGEPIEGDALAAPAG